ncbi:rCG39217 [Rattus norvegicus]|uniref:RCG39217 n=1 Tax=Rattus norvegicus TaxID=10116 RepID=A6KMG1_RAT|nr:rCG39217 [Rattus norvegicus]
MLDIVGATLGWGMGEGYKSSIRKAEQAIRNKPVSSILYGLCFSSCLHVSALSSCPAFPY